MLTRKEKREQEKNKNYFFEFMKISQHFFKDFFNKLKKVKDHRHKSYVEYGTDVILLLMIVKNMASLESMRGMSTSLNNEESIGNIKKVLGLKELEELPHYDTVNDFLSGLELTELEKIRTYMIKELLKKRSLENNRVEGKLWGVIFDGTGLYKFDKKHCAHCLKREYKDKETGETKTVYMHHVLEAKLVVGEMVYSIGSEFIENENEEVSKQDCELKAFYRLAEKIKQTYPRLPICILGDSLYACEPVFKRCEEYRWKYIFRFKEGRIKTVSEEFNTIKRIEQSNKENIIWVNGIEYRERTVNVIESTQDQENGKSKRFLFMTDIKITTKNANKIVATGRSRWKIENQGFNTQKNIRYHIEHASSHNYTAMKNHYLLTQITDILMQLFENGLRILKEHKKTAKEISSNLLEAIRTRRLTDEDIALWVKPIQIRFT